MSDTPKLSIVITADNKTAEGVRGARVEIDGLSEQIEHFADTGVSKLAELAAEVFAVREAFKFLGEGITKSDQISDLSASLTVFTGSARSAREEMEFFEKAQVNTRNTSEELEMMFRDSLPQATSRFGAHAKEIMSQVTVELSQLATIAGKTPEEMTKGFDALLAGRVSPGRNPLLATLGITKADVDGLGWEQILDKMHEVSGNFDDFGQSWESTLHKMKETMLADFAEGFTGISGNARDAKQALLDFATDPAIHDGLAELGSLARNLLETLKAYRELREGDNGSSVDMGYAHLFDPVSSNFRMLNPDINRQRGLTGLPLDYFSSGDPADNKYSTSDPSDPNSVDYTDRMRWLGVDFRGLQTVLPGQRAGKAAADQAGISNVTGFGGDIVRFYSELGQTLQQHKDKASEIIASIKDEVHGGSIAWTDYSSSIQEAIKPTGAAIEGIGGLGDVAVKAGDKADKAGQQVASLIDRLHAMGAVTDAQMQNAALIADARMKTLGVTDPGEKSIAAYGLQQAEAEAQYNLKIAEAEKARVESTNRLREARAQLGASSSVVVDAEKAIGDAFEKSTAAAKQAKEIADDLALQQMLLAFGSAKRQSTYPLLAPGGNVGNGMYVDGNGHFIPAPTDGSSQELPYDWNFQHRFSGLIQDGMFNSGSPESEQAARNIAKAQADEWKRQMLDQRFMQQFGDAFSAILINGVSGIGDALKSNFRSLLADAGQNLSQYLFGTAGNSTLKDASGAAQIPSHLYDAQGNDITGRAKTGREIAAGAGALYNGYQDGASDMANPRLNGALQGAAAGSAFGPWGAVIGAALGYIGAAIGASSKVETGGIPRVDAGGSGDVIEVSGKLDSASVKQLTRAIQSTFDTMRDGLVRDYIAGGMTPPGLDKFTNLSPGYSSRLSPEDMQKWIDGTLPTDELNRVGDDMLKIGTNLGLSSGRMAEIWNALGKIDPKQVPQLLETLFTGLSKIKDTETWLHTPADPMLGNQWTKTDVFHSTWTDLQSPKAQNADIVKQAADIEKFESTISSFSVEGQIQAYGQLGDQMNAFRDTVKAAITDLFNTAKTERQKYEDAFRSIDVQRFTKADGTVDNYGLSQYYKNSAQNDLANMGVAKNAGDLQKWNEKYVQDIMSAGSAGIAGDPTHSQDWLDWEQTNLKTGQKTLDKKVSDLGLSIDKAVDDFNTKFDPAFAKLTSAFDDLGKTIGGGGNGPGGGGPDDGVIGPIGGTGKAFSALNPNIIAASSAFTTLTTDINVFRASLTAMPTGGGGNAGGGASVLPYAPATQSASASRTDALLATNNALLSSIAAQLAQIEKDGRAVDASEVADVLANALDAIKEMMRANNFAVRTILANTK